MIAKPPNWYSVPRHQRCWHGKFDNHHTVQRPDKQDKGHAHSDLKQGQPQKPGQRNILRRNICKWQISRGNRRQTAHGYVTQPLHVSPIVGNFCGRPGP